MAKDRTFINWFPTVREYAMVVAAVDTEVMELAPWLLLMVNHAAEAGTQRAPVTVPNPSAIALYQDERSQYPLKFGAPEKVAARVDVARKRARAKNKTRWLRVVTLAAARAVKVEGSSLEACQMEAAADAAREMLARARLSAASAASRRAGSDSADSDDAGIIAAYAE